MKLQSFLNHHSLCHLFQFVCSSVINLRCQLNYLSCAIFSAALYFVLFFSQLYNLSLSHRAACVSCFTKQCRSQGTSKPGLIQLGPQHSSRIVLSFSLRLVFLEGSPSDSCIFCRTTFRIDSRKVIIETINYCVVAVIPWDTHNYQEQ